MALIRCSKCGNLVSDKASACPICGEEVGAPAAAAPKTLNDILAERGAAPVTVNDRLQQQSAGQTPPSQQSDRTGRVVAEEPLSGQTEREESVRPRQMGEESGAQSGFAGPTPGREDRRSPDEDYRPADRYDDERYDDFEERRRRSLMGYRIALIILILIIIPLAFFFAKYVNKVREVERNAELVTSAKQLLEQENSQLEADVQDYIAEFESMKIQNDTMLIKYQEAKALADRLQKEKTYNYNELNKYKRELATLKDVMKGYLRQIDSLNSINKHLQAENISYKKEITTAQLRADVAEEKAEELNTKVRIGSVIRARSIALSPLNAKSKPVSRVKNAERLRVDFELTANELAEPGQKTVYVRILSPDGYLLSPDNVITFPFEGDALLASAERTVDYENNDVPVSIFYDYSRKGLAAGTYKVQLYTEGRLIGETDIYLK